MIVFDLECIHGHTFEGWFDDSADFNRQQEDGLVTCPICDTVSVTQKLSPIAVRTSSSLPQTRNDHKDAMVELNARLTDFVEKNFENVGTSFTKEALKMHYGASEPRNIRGTTTTEEDKVLNKEGIQVLKIPLPDNSKEDLS